MFKEVPSKRCSLNSCLRLALMLTLCGCLLSFGFSVNAHTLLKSSAPADGETVRESIESIVLTFDSQVQDVIKLELMTEANHTIHIDELQHEGREVTAFLSSPLDNGRYTVNWEIVSEDGHITNGSFNFSVEAELAGAPEDGTALDEPDTTETNEAIEAPGADEPVAPDEEAPQENQALPTETAEEDTLLPWLGLILVVIVIAGLAYVLWRKRS
ncbi:copper resistance protein CopC [Caldalkalibacillus thermarum TA2.A1]|uniref:Copper resistance protein CopC n=1 Tax=Caldalkalibacillus thermarum (strain TA2.A1) TaxID=986075 RepID=F5L6T5_CALTT|nr:copper resistance CopC family protein [Caldalkalibacillus thermarum]EGL82921.1 copper resistance protein CopC [Caldalkalibacillus thermarum TA2.A1]